MKYLFIYLFIYLYTIFICFDILRLSLQNDNSTIENIYVIVPVYWRNYKTTDDIV